MISVLLATHNGVDTIERTLAAMSEIRAPAEGWELVVVNNASTDDTERRVLEWRDKLPLRYLVEPRLGKAAAINAGLGRVTGDLVVMTDDDVLPDPDWLLEWRRAADSLPQCSVFGGAIIPEFDGPPPVWTMPEGSYTVLYGETPPYGEGEIEPRNVSGANIAVRASLLAQGWRFGEAFLVGKRGLMGEDADFVRRLGAAGQKVGFAPTARVRHIIHPEQKSWRWIQNRFFRIGRTMFMLEDVKPGKDGPVFRIPYWRFRRTPSLLWRMFLSRVRGDRKALFAQAQILANDLGAIWQAVSLTWERFRPFQQK
jgi:GT2 family glycosyltransferase